MVLFSRADALPPAVLPALLPLLSEGGSYEALPPAAAVDELQLASSSSSSAAAAAPPDAAAAASTAAVSCAGAVVLLTARLPPGPWLAPGAPAAVRERGARWALQREFESRPGGGEETARALRRRVDAVALLDAE